MHWTYCNKIFAEVDPGRSIRLLGRGASGRYRLRLELSPLMQPRADGQHLELLWLAGNLSTMQSSIALLALEEPCTLRTATTAYGDGIVGLSADLSYRQISAMNDMRLGDGSLRLRLAVWGHAQGPEGVQRIHGTDQLLINDAEWRKVLEETNFAKTILIEVETPVPSVPSWMDEAVEALADAKRLLTEARQATEAVGECRHALDAIKPTPPLPDGVAITCGERQLNDLSLQDRVKLLRYVVRHATHVPHHDRRAEFSMEDGRLIVQLTAALIAHALAGGTHAS
jgi:hypothetical protein